MPRFHRRALALGLTTLAVAAAPAAAMPIDPPVGDSAAARVSAHDYDAYGASAGGLAAPSDVAARGGEIAAGGPPRVQSTDTGVDWGSAALGGGAVAIVALGSLGALAITGRKRLSAPR